MKIGRPSYALGTVLGGWLVSMILLSSSSCMIVSYQPVNKNRNSIIPQEKTLESLYFVIKRSYEKERNAVIGVGKVNMEKILPPTDEDYHTLRNALDHSSPAKSLIEASELQQSQIFINIVLSYDYESSYSHKGWCEVTFMTLAIIPCYGDLSVHHVEYGLYIDGVLQRKYHYRYAGKGAYWIGLLPFSWINLFTDGREDALADTVSRFFNEAKQDRLF